MQRGGFLERAIAKAQRKLAQFVHTELRYTPKLHGKIGIWVHFKDGRPTRISRALDDNELIEHDEPDNL